MIIEFVTLDGVGQAYLISRETNTWLVEIPLGDDIHLCADNSEGIKIAIHEYFLNALDIYGQRYPEKYIVECI